MTRAWCCTRSKIIHDCISDAEDPLPDLVDRETNTMTTSSIGVLKIYRRDPDNVVTWEEAKAKILSKSALLEVVFLPGAEGNPSRSVQLGSRAHARENSYFSGT